MNNSKKHRIGILVKNLEQKNFNGELIQNILNSKNLILDTIIINEENRSVNGSTFTTGKDKSLFRLLQFEGSRVAVSEHHSRGAPCFPFVLFLKSFHRPAFVARELEDFLQEPVRRRTLRYQQSVG